MNNIYRRKFTIVMAALYSGEITKQIDDVLKDINHWQITDEPANGGNGDKILVIDKHDYTHVRKGHYVVRDFFGNIEELSVTEFRDTYEAA